MTGMRTDQWRLLQESLRRRGRVLVAFSGGSDSALVLAAARRTLGKGRVLSVTAVSPSLAGRDLVSAEEMVRRLDVRHQLLETRELDNPRYSANPANRCFYCKEELFSRLAPLARAHQMIIVDGYNVSDRDDVRPGRESAQAWGVVHPLEEANLDKRGIRVLSRWLRLPTWNKPASPCLSSRIPYGIAVTPDVLRRIEQAEDKVRSEGFFVLRVRHYGTEARIEVPLRDLPRLQEPERWDRIERSVKDLGYERVTADPRGFQSGRLNAPNARAVGNLLDTKIK